ncbi:MAG TPA: helix-turn-helix domain-containing protein [Candidatus Polarisedimenticolaceae bacterium]|nr:helix-turn-helix domain-containing protein [Candidatus Polarisedimenticolaceae bacterium]
MKRPHVVPAKLLASPLRAEIIGRLQTEGPLSIRELAEHLARPASGLYHHVRLLEEGGVVRESDRRRSGRRDEVVYALTTPRVGGASARDAESRAGIAAAAQTALRMAGREFTAALETTPRSKRSRLRLSRQRIWLSEDGAKKALALLRRLEALLDTENRKRRGKLHVVTTVFVPLASR